jgi:integrase
MKTFPRARESPGRVPDISLDLFWRIVALTPEHMRASYVAIAAMGVRPGEYLALQPTDLQPFTHSVRVPGTKTAGSEDTIRVGEEAWDWVQRAVPSPVRYKWLYKHWKRACKAAGAPTLTLQDLRHFYGQILTDGGRPEVSVQHGLRHTDPRMTRRYIRQKDRGENARMMDTLLFPEQPPDTARKA